MRSASSPTGQITRARAAERRAYRAAQAAHRLALSTSPDADEEGWVAQSAAGADHAWHECRQHLSKCCQVAQVDRDADREEKKEAAEDAAMYARLAERAADSAEEHRHSAEQAAKQSHVARPVLRGARANRWTG